MKQYLVTGYDFTDEGALQRRMNVRPHHIENLKTLKANGNYLLGGAVLNDEDNMIGSVMVMQFEDDDQLEAWKQGEPYITQKIWESVDVKPFKVASV